MNTQLTSRHTSWTSNLWYALFCLLLISAVTVLTPFPAHADAGIAVGYTGMHDGQRGRVIAFDYRPGFWHLQFGAGNISHTLNRDTTWAGVQYMIVDRDLFAGFGPALITRQTSTLTSQYQFITTFGWHHDHWSLAVRHISNGGTRGDNIGENLVTLGWSF